MLVLSLAFGQLSLEDKGFCYSVALASGKTFAEWWTTFDCAPADSAKWIDTFGNAVFKGGLEGLRKHLGK